MSMCSVGDSKTQLTVAAELALGYRYWSGIGVRDDCMASLDWYQNAAEKGQPAVSSK